MEYCRLRKAFDKKVILLGLTFFFTFIGNSAFSHTCPDFTDSTNAEIFNFPTQQGTANSRWVYQEFHHNGEPNRTSVSGWRIRFSERAAQTSSWSLAIEEAWYTTTEGREIKVLGGLWPAQIWVPYAQENTVILDLEHGAKLTPMSAQYLTWECSELGPAYDTPHDDAYDPFYDGQRPIFVKELHDYGIAEMRINQLLPENELWRRGTELVVWANSDAGNYDNYIKYHFRDDGQILAFVGTSGWNSSALHADFLPEPTGFARSGWAPHLHSTLWRIHPKIGDWQLNDKVYKVSYNQDLQAHNDREKLNINQIEKEMELNDEEDEYISILFEDKTTIYGKNMGYAV